MTKTDDQPPEPTPAKSDHPAQKGVHDLAARDGAADPPMEEQGGPKGKEPTRYGDWENKGIAWDF